MSNNAHCIRDHFTSNARDSIKHSLFILHFPLMEQLPLDTNTSFYAYYCPEGSPSFLAISIFPYRIFVLY